MANLGKEPDPEITLRIRDLAAAIVNWGGAGLSQLDLQSVECQVVRSHLRNILKCGHQLGDLVSQIEQHQPVRLELVQAKG